MGIIVFYVLSVAACFFLIYALAHFHQELMRLGKKPAGHSLSYLGSFGSDSPAPKSPFGASEEQQPQNEEAVRGGTLTGGTLVFIRLFAPFVFVKLLRFPSIGHR